jgi:hypothetical protein
MRLLPQEQCRTGRGRKRIGATVETEETFLGEEGVVLFERGVLAVPA